MPIALLIIGLVLVVSGVRDTYADLGKTIQGDFLGQGSFLPRAGAILMLGVVGYAGPDFRKLSIGLMILLTLGLLLTKDKGFFAQLGNAIRQGPTASKAAPASSSSAPSPSSSPLANGASALQLGAMLLL
jgi:hypothetical protein